MPHFRLREPDDFQGKEDKYCDQASVEEALADFGHQLNAVLELDGDVMDYVIYERPPGDVNFKKSEGKPVTILKS